MSSIGQVARRSAIAVSMLALGACTNAGSLGNVLGGVLGQPMSNQTTGVVQSVDTRYQQITLQQPNGQTINVSYDNQTQVVYQNQNYPVTSLEYGDQVTVRLQQNGNNNGYYTDLVQVTQPVNGSVTNGSTNQNNVQSLQGTVRQVDQNNGIFTIDTGNNVLLTVSMPYRPSSADINRFQSLRAGDFVRLYGVYLSTTRVELRQFY